MFLFNPADQRLLQSTVKDNECFSNKTFLVIQIFQRYIARVLPTISRNCFHWNIDNFLLEMNNLK